jgi:hypothetical protein
MAATALSFEGAFSDSGARGAPGLWLDLFRKGAHLSESEDENGPRLHHDRRPRRLPVPSVYVAAVQWHILDTLTPTGTVATPPPGRAT